MVFYRDVNLYEILLYLKCFFLLSEIQSAHHIHEKNLKMLSDEIDMLNEKLKKDLDAINEKVVSLEICS